MKDRSMVRRAFYLAFSFAACIAVLLTRAIILWPQGASGLPDLLVENGIAAYCLELLVFGAVFVVAWFALLPLLRRFQSAEPRKLPGWAGGLAALALVALGVALLVHWALIGSKGEYTFTISFMQFVNFPVPLVVVVAVSALAAIGCALVKQYDISRYTLWSVYAVALVVAFYATYRANIFRDDAYHTVAVLESIYNVYDLVPFTRLTSGVYGHYALFFSFR